MMEMQESELREIQTELSRVVREAKADPRLEWHSGWTGNIFINVFHGRNVGLCHHWQEYVHQEMRPVVLGVGWACTGVRINYGHDGEHHAVAVYDPTRVDERYLLSARPTDPVYVLDAWTNGRPEIYRIGDWIKLADPLFRPIELEEIPPWRP